MRIDPLGLHKLLPSRLVTWLFAKGALLVRQGIQEGERGMPDATIDDFPIHKAKPDDIDLLAHQSGLHTDIPRLLAGGVGLQFWSVWVPASDPTPLATTLEVIGAPRSIDHCSAPESRARPRSMPSAPGTHTSSPMAVGASPKAAIRP